MSAQSEYGLASRTLEELCEIEITKQGLDIELAETSKYSEDQSHSRNKLDSILVLTRVVDCTTSWYFSSGSNGESNTITRAKRQGQWPCFFPKSTFIQSYMAPSDWYEGWQRNLSTDEMYTSSAVTLHTSQMVPCMIG